jgi:hypothetical protein
MEDSCLKLSLTQLVTNIVATVRMLLIWVFNGPHSSSSAVVIGHALLGRSVNSLLVVEAVAVEIRITSDISFILHGIDLDDLALQPIQHRVDSKRKDVLMVLRSDAGCDDDLVSWVLGFVLGEKVCVHDSGRLDFQFHGSGEIKGEVETVLGTQSINNCHTRM